MKSNYLERHLYFPDTCLLDYNFQYFVLAELLSIHLNLRTKKKHEK